MECTTPLFWTLRESEGERRPEEARERRRQGRKEKKTRKERRMEGWGEKEKMRLEIGMKK